jgi:peroxiredoxin
MNGKKAKAARRAVQAVQAPKRRQQPQGTLPLKRALIGLVVVSLIGASFVVPKLFDKQAATAVSGGHPSMASSDVGTGLKPGTAVPSFSERDVETGQAINSKSVASHKTLLFFSEGVMCQACFEQIKGLEQMGAELHRRGIELVSITPDSPAELKQAIGQYGISSPMIADDDRSMSQAFNTLGRGMHGDTPGHAFALVDRGKVVWYHDYWLPPEQKMYVDPAQVLADLRSA